MTKEEKAVHILDLFTKTWCMERDSDDELKFECSRCEFQHKYGSCLVKVFKRDKCEEYENFGSMVR